MKTITNIMMLGLLALLLTSCFKDDSTGPNVPVSVMTAASELDEEYVVEYGNVLTIEAPEIQQTNTAKALSYSWEINYKEVSTERTLKYECKEYGKYVIRLKVFNQDGYLYQTSSLNVLYPFTAGIYAAAKYDGKAIVSYVPASETQKVQLDILREFNPDVDFGAEASAIFFQNYLDRNLGYVATKNPNKLFRFEPYTMVLINEINAPRTGIPIDYIINSGSDLPITLMEGGHLMSLGSQDVNFDNKVYRSWRSTWGQGLSFANRILYCYSTVNSYLNSILYFDNSEGRFIVEPRQGTSRPSLIHGDTFKGHTMIDMGLILDRREVVALLKTAAGKIELAWLTPGVYVGSIGSPEAPVVRDQREVPATAQMTTDTKMASSTKSNFLYYSSDNKVYVYAVQSQGNFPTTPTFTCDEGEVIVDMLLSKDLTKLYVATNATSGDKVGSIYCFGVENNQGLLWKQKNISGEISQIFERTF